MIAFAVAVAVTSCKPKSDDPVGNPLRLTSRPSGLATAANSIEAELVVSSCYRLASAPALTHKLAGSLL
jgi:hypothetical protein